MQCPNCQHNQDNEVTCESCGIYFEKWRRREEEIKQVRTTIYVEPDNTFKIFGLGVLAASLIFIVVQKFGSDDKPDEPVVAQTTPTTPASSPQNPAVNTQGTQKPAAGSTQKPTPQEVAAYRAQLQNLRNQQYQLQRSLGSNQLSYGNRNWSGRDEAQVHADQIARQERQQTLTVQLDAVNSQIDYLIAHAPGNP